MIKEHLRFALKIAVAFIIINALLNLVEYFGFPALTSFVYDPLKSLGFKKTAPAG